MRIKPEYLQRLLTLCLVVGILIGAVHTWLVWKSHDPIITIIIPVYNAGLYLEECLNSVLTQTFQNFEVICVDDASTDNSLAILKGFAKKDKRIQLFQHTENRGTMIARETAVTNAKGQLCCFLDPDDFLTCQDALTIMVELMSDQSVDVLQYSLFAFNVSNGSEVKGINNYFRVKEQTLIGNKSILDACFAQRSLNFNLCTKIFRTSLCKKAFSYLPIVRLAHSEDALALFIIYYFTRCYKAVRTKPLYSYRIGCGISTKPQDLKLFAAAVDAHIIVLKTVKEFLVSQGALQDLSDVYDSYYNTSINQYQMGMFFRLNLEDYQSGFDILSTYYPIDELLSRLSLANRTKQIDLLTHLHFSHHPVIFNGDSSTNIGVYIPAATVAHIKYIQQSIIPYLIKTKYRIILFTESLVDDFSSMSIQAIVLPDSYNKGRLGVFSKALRNENIQVLITSEGDIHPYLFDILLAKCLEIPFALYTSSPNTNQMMKSFIQIYRLVDYVIVSNADSYSYLASIDLPCMLVSPEPQISYYGLGIVSSILTILLLIISLLFLAGRVQK